MRAKLKTLNLRNRRSWRTLLHSGMSSNRVRYRFTNADSKRGWVRIWDSPVAYEHRRFYFDGELS